MNEELKPCPFCGAEGKYFDHTEDGYPDCHEVACINTTCTYLMTNQSTKELAHKAWNTRHIPEGYALVPIKPTEHMIDAWFDAPRSEDGDFSEAYKAMIAAAQEDTQ